MLPPTGVDILYLQESLQMMKYTLLPILAGIGCVIGSSIEELCENIDRRLPCSVPELFSEASYGAEFGDFVGSATAEQTARFYASPVSCPVFKDIYDISDTFRWFIKDYMNAHTALFPGEQAELFAMAAAMDMDPTTVFMQNACPELYLMFGADVNVSKYPQPINLPPIPAPYLYLHGSSLREKSAQIKATGSHAHKVRSLGEHCSDVGVIIPETRTSSARVLHGHNEDWWSLVAHEMSIVRTPEWWGYAYPGQLPGSSFFVNSNGLTFSMNSLYPLTPGYTTESTTSRKAVSVVFAYALRSVMNATSTDAVTKQLSKFPIYSGYSLNVMSACETSITNIEGYGDRISVQSRRGYSQAGLLGHFNAYVNSVVNQDDEGTSADRMTCLNKASINSAKDVRNFLGDLDCPVFFTNINGDQHSETMSTFIADPLAGECVRYRLPASCDVSKSRCTDADYAEPSVYKWEFHCKV